MIKTLLASIDSETLKELMSAFNMEEEFYIRLPDNHFLGVHLSEPSNFEVLDHQGCWFYGKLPQ